MSSKQAMIAGAVGVSAALAAAAVAAPSRTATHPLAMGATPAAAQSVPAQAARTMHRFRGQVTSRNRAQRWFSMHTTTNHAVRIHTTSGTHWDGCDWGDMSYGHHVDVRAYRSHGRWMASRMQDWGRTGSGGWDDWDHGGMMGDWSGHSEMMW